MNQSQSPEISIPRPIPAREYYAATLLVFIDETEETILGHLTKKSDFAIEQAQTYAWREQIRILKKVVK